MPRKRRRPPVTVSNTPACSNGSEGTGYNPATHANTPNISSNTQTHSHHRAININKQNDTPYAIRNNMVNIQEQAQTSRKNKANPVRKELCQKSSTKEEQRHLAKDRADSHRKKEELNTCTPYCTDSAEKGGQCDVRDGKTVAGSDITLHVFHHGRDTCCEFVVSSPKFSFPKWLCLTAVFNGVGFLFNLHSQDQYSMTAVLAVLLVILLLKIHFKVKKESLLVMSSIGVQLTTTFASGRTCSHFICLSSVKDVIINEAVSMHSVIFYICLLLQKSNEGDTLMPLFTKTWPRLSILQHIHKHTRHLLWKNS